MITEPNKILIFLDVDGVLNRRATETFLDPNCVAVLSSIVAKVMLMDLKPMLAFSSWHRHRYDATGFTKQLRKFGYVGPRVEHTTPIFADGAEFRDREILALCRAFRHKEYNVKRVLVLDDDPHAGTDALGPHHVCPVDGLTEDHVAEALVCAARPWVFQDLKGIKP